METIDEKLKKYYNFKRYEIFQNSRNADTGIKKSINNHGYLKITTGKY